MSFYKWIDFVISHDIELPTFIGSKCDISVDSGASISVSSNLTLFLDFMKSAKDIKCLVMCVHKLHKL